MPRGSRLRRVASRRGRNVSDSDLPTHVEPTKKKKKPKKRTAPKKGSTAKSSASSSKSKPSSGKKKTAGISAASKSKAAKKKSAKKKSSAVDSTSKPKAKSAVALSSSADSGGGSDSLLPSKRVVLALVPTRSDDGKEADALPPLPDLLPSFLCCDAPSKKRREDRSALDYYKRKKNVKLLNLQRESDRVEKEWTQKWVDAFGTVIDEEMELDWGGLDVRVCVYKLLTMDEAWEHRMLLVQMLVQQLSAAECSDAEYCLKMCKFLHALGRQFYDARSLVLEGLRERIGILARSTAPRFVVFAPYFYAQVIVVFGIRIEVMRESAVNLGLEIMKACIEHDSERRQLLDAVVTGLEYKSPDGRMQSARFLCLFLESMTPFAHESAVETETDMDDSKVAGDSEVVDDAICEELEFIEFLDDAIRKAVEGSSSDVREQGYRCLNTWSTLAPKHATAIVDSMSKAVRKKYERVTLRKTSLHF